MSLHGEKYELRLIWRHRIGQGFEWLCRLATFAALAILVVLLGSILVTALRPGRGKGLAAVSVGQQNSSVADATFRVSNISGGHFELKDQPGSKITTFSEADVRDGKIVFDHDGRRESPLFDLTLTSPSQPDAPPVTLKKVGPGHAPHDVSIPMILWKPESWWASGEPSG